MKIATAAVLLILLPFTALAGGESRQEFLYDYLSGTYTAIGREPESEKTYSGKVTFESKADHLLVTRFINGESIAGMGKIEQTRSDKVDVLRVRYQKDGKDFEITYIWANDLDNYARLSGYVYQPGKHTLKPGLEALFIDHGSP